MPTTRFDKESIKQSIIGKLQRYNGRSIEEASPQQIYKALASTVRDQIMQKYTVAREDRKEHRAKRLYYLSVEFLMGRSLYCNMLNLVSTKEYREAMDYFRLGNNREFYSKAYKGYRSEVLRDHFGIIAAAAVTGFVWLYSRNML